MIRNLAQIKERLSKKLNFRQLEIDSGSHKIGNQYNEILK